MPIAPRTSRQREPQAIKHQPPVGQLSQAVMEGQMLDFVGGHLARRDVGQGGDVVGNDSGTILHNGNGEPFGIDLAVLAPVPDFSLPGSGTCNASPHRGKKIRIVSTGVEQLRCLARSFPGTIAGDAGEGPIDAQDHTRGIGDKHAFLSIKGNGGNALVCFQTHALADVGQHNTHRGWLLVLNEALAIQPDMQMGSIPTLENQFAIQPDFTFQYVDEMRAPESHVLARNEARKAPMQQFPTLHSQQCRGGKVGLCDNALVGEGEIADRGELIKVEETVAAFLQINQRPPNIFILHLQFDPMHLEFMQNFLNQRLRGVNRPHFRHELVSELADDDNGAGGLPCDLLGCHGVPLVTSRRHTNAIILPQSLV